MRYDAVIWLHLKYKLSEKLQHMFNMGLFYHKFNICNQTSYVTVFIHNDSFALLFFVIQ